jgi:hypothetical protein
MEGRGQRYTTHNTQRTGIDIETEVTGIVDEEDELVVCLVDVLGDIKGEPVVA